MSNGRPKHTKPDKNQTDITKELVAMGYDVDDVHDLPGIYDIVVSGKRMVRVRGNYFAICSVRVELKSEKGKLSDSQEKYFEKQKHKGSIIVAYKVEDILEWFGS